MADTPTIRLRVYEDDDAGYTAFDDDLDVTELGFTIDCPADAWLTYKNLQLALGYAHEHLCHLLNVHERQGVLNEPCATTDCEPFEIPAHEFRARNGERIIIPARIEHGSCRRCGWRLESHGG